MQATNSAFLWTVSAKTSTSSKQFRTRESVPLDEREAPNSSVLSVGEWLDDWLELCGRRGLRPSTVASYETMIGLHVGVALAATSITDVTASDLNQLYGRLLREGRRDGGGGLSARTVRYVHTILNRAFSDAVRAGHISANPGAAADPPSPRATRAPVFPVWSPAELAHFLESAKHDPHHVAFHLAAATGLRRGELLGLRWCDIDEAAGELHVVQTVVEVAHEARISPPKTERSRRLVALDRKTTELLARHRATTAAGTPALDDHSLVFATEGGDPIHPALFSYYFQRRVHLAGVRRIRLHDLRDPRHTRPAGRRPSEDRQRATRSLDNHDHARHVQPRTSEHAA
jgi:integrase